MRGDLGRGDHVGGLEHTLSRALLEEAASLGEKGQGGIRTKMLEPSHKEPCEGVPPGSSLARLQRLLLVHALRLRDDVEAAIRRCAAGSTHLKPQDLKTALWRVDSEIPEPRVDAGDALDGHQGVVNPGGSSSHRNRKRLL